MSLKRIAAKLHDVRIRKEAEERAAAYQPGEEVDVLIYWAHGADPAWLKGYTVVRDEGATVIVEGGMAPARYARDHVRRR